ncbi:calmodulin-binding protein 60 D-like [Curcuma longa]|uniref:calmodulin-binding protein 60 D-like n=1 Tax=Curcuma longa TaxID=136217 RepID=UPI003D9E1E25
MASCVSVILKRQAGREIRRPAYEYNRTQIVHHLLKHLRRDNLFLRNRDNKPLQVKLVDAMTKGTPVVSPSSTMKVEIVVLNGNFPSRKEEDWTADEFNSNLVKQRDGKPPLLVGECTAVLSGGMATFQEVEFSDNSRWVRTGKFVLGARVCYGNGGGARIKEAATKPFKVLDRRGEAYKKHYPPMPNDEVWRLDKIGKNGAFRVRLEKAKVRTVGEFVRLLNTDAKYLRNILGKGMSEVMWKATTKHARTCKVEEKQCLYQGQANGVPYSGCFATQMNSVEECGAGTWSVSSYQQQNMHMPAYEQGRSEDNIRTLQSNMQLNCTIVLENMDFELCDALK